MNDAATRAFARALDAWMEPERHAGFVAGAEGRVERVPLGAVGITGP